MSMGLVPRKKSLDINRIDPLQEALALMLDLFYIGIAFAFFAISISYVRGCERLLGVNDDE